MWKSGEVVFGSKLTWLLLLGPIALFGDFTDLLGEFTCFLLAAGALIPCAERLSFVTEQVAHHTNQTFGALLNATFGNAPELLISTAALRAGFYRVVQLTLLGSVLTNLLLVFGSACVVGGLRHKVQHVRLTSGNVSIGMLFLSTAGLVLPAALKLSNQTQFTKTGGTSAELSFSRVNATIMMAMYVCYLIFQLYTHKEEFDDDDDVAGDGSVGRVATAEKDYSYQPLDKPRTSPVLSPKRLVVHHPRSVPGRNIQLQHNLNRTNYERTASLGSDTNNIDLEMAEYPMKATLMDDSDDENEDSSQAIHYDVASPQSAASFQQRYGKGMEEYGYNNGDGYTNFDKISHSSRPQARKRRKGKRERNSQGFTSDSADSADSFPQPSAQRMREIRSKAHSSDPDREYLNNDSGSTSSSNSIIHAPLNPMKEAQIPFRAGIIWLLAITLCVSAMSDIIVQTIDGFAERSKLSQVFTSLVIVPFFSNIAEQTSAILFAYRNEMDLCVGITVGSAIQINLFVLPGCVLIGFFINRSMSLFFQGFETMSLVMGVLVVTSVLQGGSTNWLTGVFCIGVYFMIATGFWFHCVEDLSTDEELALHELQEGDVTVGDGNLRW